MSTETSCRLQALVAALLWGASFVATKAALVEVQPITLIVLRFGMGVAILAIAVIKAREFKWLGWRDLALVALLGFISITIHQGLQATGLKFTSAGSMAWLVALNPVFTAVLAWLFLAEPLGPVQISGLAIAFVGAVLVVSRGAFTTETLRLPSTLGDLLAMASAFNWAIFSVASKPLLRRLPPTLMMAYVMLIGWLLTLPFIAFGRGSDDITNLSAAGWVAVIFLGIFCSGMAYIFWYQALSRIDAAQVAAFTYIEPLVTVVVAAIILSEPFTPTSLVGGFTILAGVYLVNRSSFRPSQHRQSAEVRIARD